MNNISKCLFVFFILLVSVGFVCASDDVASCNDTAVLSVEDGDLVSVDDGSTDSDDFDEDSSDLSNDTEEDVFEVVTSNVTRYDFNDNYKVKVVDGSGMAVYGGHVDFYVNHTLVNRASVDYSGIASFNLNTFINSSGTYEIVSIYSANNGLDMALTFQKITVDNVPLDERDVQIIFENIKLYDSGDSYSVKVVDRDGNLVRKGHVVFVVYDSIMFSDISESGVARCTIPRDLNISGNLLVWSMYSDGQLYDLAVCEQITLNTRTLISLDKTTIGSRMFQSWNKYNYTYNDGKYIACISPNVYHVIEWNGNCYLLYEVTVNNSAQLENTFSSLRLDSNYDVVKLNLLNDTTYVIDDTVWSDSEWDYACKFSYGQLIVNGNGATIKGIDNEINFMYVGSEANVCFKETTLMGFNHCFMNHGTLYCDECVFRNNKAYAMDVLEGGAVVHNYNTILFEQCEFYNNYAEILTYGHTNTSGSILYAEPFSLNVFVGFSGVYRSDALYGSNFSTTVVYKASEDYRLNTSYFSPDAYFCLADISTFYIDDEAWIVNATNVEELISVFKILNSFVPAKNVTINLAQRAKYSFSVDDYARVRNYDWRETYYDQFWYSAVVERYLLDVGLCPVTINGNNATITITGNDVEDDYHLAYIGKYGSLTLKDLTITKFNTVFYVVGNVYADRVWFADNIIDHDIVSGDYGGVFRSFGGSIICHRCEFTGNVGDNIGDYLTDDFYADLHSYVELINCVRPVGVVKDSYIKCSKIYMSNISLIGDSIIERYDNGVEDVDFKIFNVSNTQSYNNIVTFLNNHSVSSLYINFTGDYDFTIPSQFERSMAVIFNSNGFNVKINTLSIKSSTSMTFIGFDFNNIKVDNKGSCSFINCSFHNYDEDDNPFFSNGGSCSLINCSVYDNDGDDYIILNSGVLSIYDSKFWNNDFDHDYGVIYNKGGSVYSMNNTFRGSGTPVFNFNTGDCAFSYTLHESDVVFDHPWSNQKADFVKGIFFFGTTVVTFGVGAGIGAVLPGAIGLLISSAAGAGIGFASGISYGLIEGYVYHDYSNVWKHGLTFAFMGLTMGQAGWSVGSNFLEHVAREIDGAPNAAEGSNSPANQAPQNPQNPQNPNSGSNCMDALNDDANFQELIKAYLEDDVDNIHYLLERYPDLANQIHNNYNTLISRPNINALELLNFFTIVQNVVSARANLQQSSNQVINRISNVVNNNVAVEDNVNVENLIHLEGSNILVNPNELVVGSTYLQRCLDDPESNLGYLRTMLTAESYAHAEGNRTHADNVLSLLSNFNSLVNRVRNLGFSAFSNSMIGFINTFNENIGPRGHPRTINALFNPNNPNRLAVWERIYQSASEELNRIIGASDIGEFNLDGDVNLTDQLDDRISTLIAQMEHKFDDDPANLDVYNTLVSLYNNNHEQNNTAFLLRIYKELTQLRNMVTVDANKYNELRSYNYTAVVEKNSYNGIFNRPTSINGYTVLNRIISEFKDDMATLRRINPDTYDEVVRVVLNRTSFDAWFQQVHKQALEEQLRVLRETYALIGQYLNLIYRDRNDINERNINLFYVKNLFNNYEMVYNGLSVNDRILINKYFYDQCRELIKTFNGLHYMYGLEDHTNDLKELANINDTSINYFKKLVKLYLIVSASKGIENLFNKDITNLDSNQIGNLILNDLITFNIINHDFITVCQETMKISINDLSIFAVVANLVNTNSRDELVNLYNNLTFYNDQLAIFYKLEQCLHFQLPIDADYYYNNMKFTFLLHRRMWSNDLPNHLINDIFHNIMGDVSLSLNLNSIVTLFLENYSPSENIAHDPVEEESFVKNIMFISVFNQYLKNKELAQTNTNMIDMMLIESSNLYPINRLFGPEYYNTITSLDLDLATAIQLQQNLNSAGRKDFFEIDVGNLRNKLKLFMEACPAGYWLLMDYYKSRFNQSYIDMSKWTFNYELNQFCTRDIEGNPVTYYDLWEMVVYGMEDIITRLGVVEGDNIRLKSINYNIARLVYENGYYNIFNKKNYYNQMELTEGNVGLLISDMSYDLNYLKNFNATVYQNINDLLFGGSFENWIANNNNPASVLEAYNTIFNLLSEFRDSSKVLDNEINVIINQLDSNTINNLNDINLTTQITRYMLNFIYFWEYCHKLTDKNQLSSGLDPRQIMSFDLFNKPLADIFNRYNEILKSAIFYRVFDDVDLNSLSLDEMKKLFLNNLYRAYHSDKYGNVFTILNSEDEHFADLEKLKDFEAYEDYINSITDKSVLIKWYNAIRNGIKPNTNPIIVDPVKVEDNSPVLTLDQFNDIKMIMENINLDPEKSYDIISERMIRLYGSWELIENKYPDVAKKVSELLFNNQELSEYASHNGKSSDYYRSVRQKIIDFIYDNFYKESAAEVEVVDNPIVNDILINGKPASECSVDDIYQYVLNVIRSSNINENLRDNLLGEANSAFNGYIQFVDVMTSANVPENEYKGGYNQFKNRLINILNLMKSNGDMDEIKQIMNNQFEVDEEMSITTSQYNAFLNSFARLEREFPLVAKYILEKKFHNNMDEMKQMFDFNGDEYLRGLIIDFAEEYFKNNPVKSNPIYGSNSISDPNKFVIEKENVANTNLDQIKGFMKNAVDKAYAFVEKIRIHDSVLADTLKEDIDNLYNEYLVHVESYSHQYQYIRFMEELNKLFDDLSVSDYADNNVIDNAELNSFHIKKESVKQINYQKADELMKKAMDMVEKNVKKINETNKKLAKLIHDEALKLSGRYIGSMRGGSIDAYNEFIDRLNELAQIHVGINSGNNINSELLKKMTKGGILKLIQNKLKSNPKSQLARQMNKKLTQQNLTKEDLINMYNTLNSYEVKTSDVKLRTQTLNQGSLFFGDNNVKNRSDVNQLKKSISTELKKIKTVFPNLYEGIFILFKTPLSSLSSLTKEECVRLYDDLTEYCNKYFKLLRANVAFEDKLKGFNKFIDDYDVRVKAYNLIMFNYFDTANTFFARNLDGADRDTIAEEIINVMDAIRKQDSEMYHYYLKIFFNNYPSPDEYFDFLDGSVGPEKLDSVYRQLYKNIKNYFKDSQDFFDNINKIKSQEGKRNYYISYFEKTHNVKLDSDAANFTRNLVLVIMNLDSIEIRENLTNMLLKGLNKDGSLKSDVKNEIKTFISMNLFGSQFVLKDNDFELLMEIMASDFKKSLNVQLLMNYISIINDNGGLISNETRKTAMYNALISVIAKNKVLFGANNVVLYPEELDLLNNLNALDCYELINHIIGLKLNNKFSSVNIVGLIPEINNIMNSMEYKFANHQEVNANDSHINVYYEVFNMMGNLTKDINELIDIMEKDLTKLYQSDINIHSTIMSRYFDGYMSIGEYVADRNISYAKLTNIYQKIILELNSWRNLYVISAIDMLLKDNN